MIKSYQFVIKACIYCSGVYLIKHFICFNRVFIFPIPLYTFQQDFAGVATNLQSCTGKNGKVLNNLLKNVYYAR